MRTQNSIKNITISIATQILMTLMGFISRKIFLDNLGVSYLGVNGLLSNVLSTLGLVESGIGLSIVYNLYKPLATNDKEKILALVQMYKRAYQVLALIILALSLALFPFLDKLMKEGESLKNVTIVYFIFVAKDIISYLNAHKWSLINADQKGYILARINIVFQVLITVIRILVIVSTRSYILYLVVEFAITTFQVVFNGSVVTKMYPYIKTKKKYTVEKGTKDNIIKNIRALFLHNIGGYCVFGTDNILISSFISVATVGIYSNYTMVIGQLASLITPILSGVEASVGNLIAIESSKKSYSIFRVMYLVNFWIYSVCVIFLYDLLQPFITWWIGGDYLLDQLTFVVILLNFYLTGLRSSILTFKFKAGIFRQDRYVPLLEGVINLISAVILVKYLGLVGIFIGTTISTLSIAFWNQARLVYKYVFKIPVWSYFIHYFYYAGLTVLTCLLTTFICNFVVIENGFSSLVVKGLVCISVPNMLYLVLFYNTEEFQYILSVLRSNLLRFNKKVKHSM